jgi:hypothetical protein
VLINLGRDLSQNAIFLGFGAVLDGWGEGVYQRLRWISPLHFRKGRRASQLADKIFSTLILKPNFHFVDSRSMSLQAETSRPNSLATDATSLPPMPLPAETQSAELPPMPLSAIEWIPLWQRCLLFGVGTILITLLIIAACLPPNPSGMGTHRALGLPPCSFILLFDMRCPACGMTTSWAHTVRGQLISAAQANTGGMLLAISSALLGPWMLASAGLGRWWFGTPNPGWLLAWGGTIFFVTTVQWCGRVFL